MANSVINVEAKSQMQQENTNTTANTQINNAPIYKEKSMPLALILSFLLPGIGIVYA